MRRLIVLAIVALFAGLGATSMWRVEMRLDELADRPAARPADLDQLRDEIGAIRASVTESVEELEALRTVDKRTHGLRRRLDVFEDQLTVAEISLAAHERQFVEIDNFREQAGPRALDARMASFAEEVGRHWRQIDEVAQTAIGIAEATSANLDMVRHNLARDTDRMWRELVGPTVQLNGESTVGSGVLLRSELVEAPDEYRTYLVTAWHVVRDIIDDDEDFKTSVPVNIYAQDGRIFHEFARLLTHNAGIDAALLEMNTTRDLECGAVLATPRRLERARIFEQVYAVGCPLGNDPIPTFGEIADTSHEVDGEEYWMISAPTYIGNSGGGIFDAEDHELLGIFSKIYTHGALRPTVVPHMGLVTPMTAVYDWLESAGYGHVVPSSTSGQAEMAAAERASDD